MSKFLQCENETMKLQAKHIQNKQPDDLESEIYSQVHQEDSFIVAAAEHDAVFHKRHNRIARGSGRNFISVIKPHQSMV